MRDDLIRQIACGKKTVTRRFIPYQPKTTRALGDVWQHIEGNGWVANDKGLRYPVKCKYGTPGDELYIKEAFTQDGQFRSDTENPDTVKWTSPIFMPRAMARYTLLITDIYPERLQDITEREAKREGFRTRNEFIDVWRELTSSIDAQMQGRAWDANPYVWRVAFELMP